MIKKFFALILMLFISISLSQVDAYQNGKILMIIASQNFRDEELLKPKEIFEKQGFKVVIASSSLGVSKGMLGAEVKPHILINEVKVKDYKAVIFVGGTGAKEYFNNPIALRIAQDSMKESKVIGAICIAPRILAEAGILKGKKATVWKSEAEQLKTKGAIYTGADVEIEGLIVTASGPHAAENFGKAIVKLIK